MKQWNIGDLIRYKNEYRDRLAYGVVVAQLNKSEFQVLWFDDNNHSIEKYEDPHNMITNITGTYDI